LDYLDEVQHISNDIYPTHSHNGAPIGSISEDKTKSKFFIIYPKFLCRFLILLS